MNNHWILDVLSDLKVFATQNRLEQLAEQLQLSFVVASLELANREPRETIAQDGNGTGQVIRLVSAGRNA